MRLLVPIAVDALVVRGDEEPLADLRIREPEGDGPVADLLPPPFSERDERKAGIYLHWALPDALTHGAGDAQGVSMPAVPDRFLVVRLAPSEKQRLVRAWVVVAGGAKPETLDLAKFSEAGRTSDTRAPLTAFGHGHPAWAALFDSAEGRLTFHDPLDDVADGAIAYLVCGWHADPGLDPLGGAFAAGREQRAEALRWRAPTGGAPSAEIAGSTLYHGAVVGIGWPTAPW